MLILLGSVLPLIILLLVPIAWFDYGMKYQQELIENSLGTSVFLQVQQKTDESFLNIFINSGLKRALVESLLPNEVVKLKSKGLEELGSIYFHWLEERIELFFVWVYGLLLLGYALQSFIGWVLILLLCLIIEGQLTRRICYYRFELSNPFLFRIGLDFSWVVFCVWYVLFVAPIGIDLWIYQVGLLLLGVGLYLVSKHIQNL